jgi:hypothetical protein
MSQPPPALVDELIIEDILVGAQHYPTRGADVFLQGEIDSLATGIDPG